eukprot:gnl/Trimastix_PCT/946.p2 GENE.gnl/Trimastix_PCT/946~~gnl/Trimastix_PCT/946.p2  ORF type:complete len:364 (+),score=119.45 gnl/Trimastix_PCT/946:79-1092(+)
MSERCFASSQKVSTVDKVNILKRAYRELKDRYDALQEEYADHKTESRVQIEQLEKDKERMEPEREELKKRAEDFQKEADDMKRALEELKAQCSEEKDRLEEELNDVTMQNMTLEEELREAKDAQNPSGAPQPPQPPMPVIDDDPDPIDIEELRKDPAAMAQRLQQEHQQLRLIQADRVEMRADIDRERARTTQQQRSIEEYQCKVRALEDELRQLREQAPNETLEAHKFRETFGLPEDERSLEQFSCMYDRSRQGTLHLTPSKLCFSQRLLRFTLVLELSNVKELRKCRVSMQDNGLEIWMANKQRHVFSGLASRSRCIEAILNRAVERRHEIVLLN